MKRLRCPKCGFPNDLDSTTCVECGHDLEEALEIDDQLLPAKAGERVCKCPCHNFEGMREHALSSDAGKGILEELFLGLKYQKTYRETVQRQLDKVDEALPEWIGTSRGRV